MSLLARMRHPLAAVCAVGGVVVGSVALIGTAASAAAGEATGTTTFTCAVGSFDPYDYEATITVSAARAAAGDTKVTVDATISDMPGVVPVTLGKTAVTDELELDLGGTAVTLKGSGTTTITKGTAFPMPSMTGTLTTDADSVSATVTSFSFAMPTYSMSGSCTPTDGADLGTLTIGTGATSTPTESPTESPTETATATPTETATATATATATESADTEAVPAKGKVAFSCNLQPFNSDFDYDATVTVSGYREAEGDPVQLVAKMSELPGIAPVTIDGDMDVTLDAEVGGTAVTLTGSGHATAEPEAPVAVPKLTGEVEADEDELEVAVTAFTFDFASLSVSADCTADRTVLGTMVVGTEAPDDTDTDTDTDTGTDTGTDTSTGGTSSSGSLPKTGGADSTPVVLLWAGAFVLLGTAGLLVVPQARLARRRQD